MSDIRFERHLDAATRAKALAADVRRGLTARPRWLPPKYFYDETGSALFERITALPEYYLTRVERDLLAARAPDFLRRLAPVDLVELGAGTAAKLRLLLGAGDGASPLRRYVPVDMDEATLAAAARRLTAEHPGLAVHGVVGDFQRHLVHVPARAGRRLVAFLGSTIGNLDPTECRALLDDVRRLLGPGDRFLLGVDLVKDRRVLEAAYDDAAGVTRAFNRNILHVVNRGLDGDFEPEAFRHHAWYNAEASRIEMHLVAETPQRVRLRRLDLTIEFAPGEGIWTESSYKFTRASTQAMLEAAGLGLEEWWTDAGERFALAVAAV